MYESTPMHAATAVSVPSPAKTHDNDRYARCIEISKQIRWDIDTDVIRGRTFDFGKKFLPDGLSMVGELAFLEPAEARLLSQIQGRTYANMFALVERFIGAKTTELGRDHALGDQMAFEALLRLTEEELKHQKMFRRLERMAAVGMPAGYAFLPKADEVAAAVLSKSNWAVLALTLDIELFSQAHYRSSIEPDASLSELWKDVFLFHWKEESQHAVLDELEWRREDARISGAERDRGVAELIELVGAVDGICQMQARADADFFLSTLRRPFGPTETAAVHALVLKAYRWQYIVSGAQEPRFQQVLKALVTPAQMQRVLQGLAPFFAEA